MKNKPYVLILILGLLLSCSKNDDSKPEMGWFPVKITKTDFLADNGDREIEIRYSNKNLIAEIEITRTFEGFTDKYSITYNSSNEVESMQLSSNDPSYVGITTYTFNYEDGLIVSWTTNTVNDDGENVGSGFRPVTYNHPTYIVNSREMDIDINNNISRMKGFLKNTSEGDAFPEFFLHRLPNTGVFVNVEPKVTLQLLFTVFFWMEMDFYAFSMHEISHLQLPWGTIDFQTTRNQDGQIVSVLTASGNVMYAKYEYEYERREK